MKDELLFLIKAITYFSALNEKGSNLKKSIVDLNYSQRWIDVNWVYTKTTGIISHQRISLSILCYGGEEGNNPARLFPFLPELVKALGGGQVDWWHSVSKMIFPSSSSFSLFQFPSIHCKLQAVAFRGTESAIAFHGLGTNLRTEQKWLVFNIFFLFFL